MEDTDFKGLSIHRVTEADFNDVKKFLLVDFLYNEPLNRSVSLNAEDSDAIGIASSLSYVLRAPDGEIAALRLAAIHDRPEEEHEDQIWILINPRVKRLVLWSVISVRKDFTRRGLAEKLLCYKLDEARQMGCQGCFAEASAFKSQSLFEKIGYEKIHEVKHAEWLDDKGQQIFQCDDSTDSIQLVFKPL
uniref:N-acetyltransferase domain-containing protein n=1 Tax=Elaeophora elaphi TaxID=1147741 RepID=A0A0R3S5V6_9BILA